MFGTTIGIAFALTSVASGFSLAFGGMSFVLTAAAVATALAIVLLALVKVPEKEIPARPEGTPQMPGKDKRFDIAGTIRAPSGLLRSSSSQLQNLLGGVSWP